MVEGTGTSGSAPFVVTELDGRILSAAGTGAEVNCPAEVQCGAAEVQCGPAEVQCGAAEVQCAEVNCPGGFTA